MINAVYTITYNDIMMQKLMFITLKTYVWTNLVYFKVGKEYDNQIHYNLPHYMQNLLRSMLLCPIKSLQD